jgi:hypothetical protein
MPYTSDDDLPSISDEAMRQGLASTRPYTVLILKAGPNIAMPDVQKVIWEHGRRNFALRAAGLLPIVCPIGDGSGVTGIGIFSGDVEEVRRIYENDPGVKAGVFTFEVHPSRSFPGDCLPG